MRETDPKKGEVFHIIHSSNTVIIIIIISHFFVSVGHYQVELFLNAFDLSFVRQKRAHGTADKFACRRGGKRTKKGTSFFGSNCWLMTDVEQEIRTCLNTSWTRWNSSVISMRSLEKPRLLMRKNTAQWQLYFANLPWVVYISKDLY